MTEAVVLTITGRVQGVSFRAYAEDEAARLGITGWVRNEPDGSVAVHAEGDPDAVAAFVAWCQEGPGPARVERVDARATEATGASRFEVRY